MSEELPPSEAPRPDEADSVDETRAAGEARTPGETRAAGEARAADETRVAGEARATDDDAWATACAEDLEAEKARRRAEYGPPPGSAAEELRRLVDTVADKLSGLQSPLLGQVAGPAAQQVVRQVVQQAKAAVEPVIERNPDLFDHLAAAGGELLAAYRSAVQNQERRWTTGDTAAKDPRDPRDQDEREADGRDEDDGGTGPGQRIDLD
ncbi:MULTISPECIES: DUF5304 domain-containing protein [Streptomyces]|uniref:DUF5304 domain-containing protein n=1 Tax=Streptomyces TaxID=1883 RepID=UPI0013DCA744|nr:MULTISPECIES: DUF5304 domain-containing protein [Streptomyces]KAF2780631.1 hypothetical protein STPH1_5301 [Streptomyces sp. OM5714]MDI6515776.1 DUF5304 family protein [Streptomyces coelicoflavus]